MPERSTPRCWCTPARRRWATSIACGWAPCSTFGRCCGSLFGAAILLGTICCLYTQNQQALAVWVNRIYLLRDETWPRSALIEVVGVELLGPEDAPQAAGDVPLIAFRDGSLKVAKGSNLRLQGAGGPQGQGRSRDLYDSLPHGRRRARPRDHEPHEAEPGRVPAVHVFRQAAARAS